MLSKRIRAAYRDHFNSKKGGKSQGDIVWESYNEPMHRGELIVKLANDKWGDDLEKLAAGEPIYFSMGCGVRYDWCSRCGNKASKKSEYCDHLKFQKLAIDSEGNMVYAYNDAPHFHDISRVARPADRIAFGLAKVASEGTQVVLEKDEAVGLYLPVSLVRAVSGKREADRYGLLHKLAKLEKDNLLRDNNLNDLALSFIKSAKQEEDILDKLSDIPLEKLFSSLNNNNMMLTPNTFVHIVLKKKPEEVNGVEGLPKALKTIFSDLIEGGDLGELAEDSSFGPCIGIDRDIEDKVKGLSDLLSLDAEPVKRRIIKITISGKPEEQKEAMLIDEPSPEAKYLAKEYAKYQLTFLANNNKEDNILLAALQNQVI
jgi:hypothetical protein